MNCRIEDDVVWKKKCKYSSSSEGQKEIQWKYATENNLCEIFMRFVFCCIAFIVYCNFNNGQIKVWIKCEKK